MSRFGCDDDSSVEDWSVISLQFDDNALLRPASKPKPSPKPAPKYRFSLDAPRASWVGHTYPPQSKGLAPPAPPTRVHDSTFQRLSPGLPAPQISVPTPRSLQPSSTVVPELSRNLQDPCGKAVASTDVQLPEPSFPGSTRKRGMDPLVRCKQASQSPVVRQLWQSMLSKNHNLLVITKRNI